MGALKKRLVYQGFTLIELLIVIGIIAVLAAATFVALNPLKRFEDSRDARRRADISAILSAIKVDQVDNGGPYLASITGLADDTPSMIGTSASGCNAAGIACADVVIATAACVDLAELKTDGYLGEVPSAPQAGTGGVSYSSTKTGYTLTKSPKGIITVQACDAEGAAEIKLSR
jgi:prepilin-type N-terminal cleavage/methylation domain-containing protein